MVIDPIARRVVARHRIDGVVVTSRRAGDSLVALTAPQDKLGTARLVVVGADGAVRSTVLDRITVAQFWPKAFPSDPIGTQRVPGLAVDAAGGRAFVVDPSGLVAEVDLARLRVSYHDTAAPASALARIAAWLHPAAQAKGMNGPYRTARWLGDGWLAVAGSDESATRDKSGNVTMSSRPSGLQLIDTRDWSARTLEAGANAFTVADGLLLATGASWSSADQQSANPIGLAAYGSDARLRFRALPGVDVGIDFAVAGRAYVYDGHGINAVDLATGRVTDQFSGDLPWVLLDDG
jgi:hypothetical protein